MTTIIQEETVLDINQGFLNNYKDPQKSIDLFMQIIIKEYSIVILSTKKGKKFPTFNHYIEENMYQNVSNYTHILDYDNCVNCLMLNWVRIKETSNPDIKRELRSINNLLACLATYCKDCPAGIKAKDFI